MLTLISVTEKVEIGFKLFILIRGAHIGGFFPLKLPRKTYLIFVRFLISGFRMVF